MSEKKQKSFEEKLHSQKIGSFFCIWIFIATIVSSFSGIQNGNIIEIISLIISTIMLILVLLIPGYTKKKNILGPTLERYLGILAIIEGIICIFTSLGIIFCLIFIITASIGLLTPSSCKDNEGISLASITAALQKL